MWRCTITRFLLVASVTAALALPATGSLASAPSAQREPGSGGTVTPVNDVDPLIGTSGGSKGAGMNPSVTAPFGMIQWSAMTRQNRVSVKPYAYEDNSIEGFIGTHQPAIWMGDYGYVSMMPGVGGVKTGIDDRKLPFSHENEVSTPYYYSVDMDAGSAGTIKGEITSTAMAGV